MKRTTPFSDAELAEFRELLEAKRAAASGEIDAMRAQLRNARESDSDTAYGSHMADAGSDAADVEQTYRLIARQQEYLTHVDRALARIENGTYGVCKVSGAPISADRLRAVPHTETSIAAKLKQKR